MWEESGDSSTVVASEGHYCYQKGLVHSKNEKKKVKAIFKGGRQGSDHHRLKKG